MKIPLQVPIKKFYCLRQINTEVAVLIYACVPACPPCHFCFSLIRHVILHPPASGQECLHLRILSRLPFLCTLLPTPRLGVCCGFVFLTLTLQTADSSGSLPFPFSSLAGHCALHCLASCSPSSEKTVQGLLVSTLER